MHMYADTAANRKAIIYAPDQLTKQAKAAVKGKGRYAGWAIRFLVKSDVSASLLAYYYDKEGRKAFVPHAL